MEFGRVGQMLGGMADPVGIPGGRVASGRVG
jgi:hypothetical protein